MLYGCCYINAGIQVSGQIQKADYTHKELLVHTVYNIY